MAKTKVETKEELTTEEESLLKMFSINNKEDEITLPNLAINIASEDADGNEIPVKTFTIHGTKLYSKTVRFRPFAFYNKLIAMKQDDKKNWKAENETILYTREQPIDARGGVGCGRLMGRSIPDTWTEDQKRANKAKAQFYGFLYGTVEFPGEKPVLVNFRIPAGKAVQMSNALRELDKPEHGGFQKYVLNLTLSTNPKDKSSPHPVLTIEPDMTTKLPISGTGEYMAKIKEVIESHNNRVRTSHANAKLARKTLNEDIEITDDVLDDTIPF